MFHVYILAITHDLLVSADAEYNGLFFLRGPFFFFMNYVKNCIASLLCDKF